MDLCTISTATANHTSRLEPTHEQEQAAIQLLAGNSIVENMEAAGMSVDAINDALVDFAFTQSKALRLPKSSARDEAVIKLAECFTQLMLDRATRAELNQEPMSVEYERENYSHGERAVEVLIHGFELRSKGFSS